MNLRAIDLNLLVILNAILAEESVTKAARRIPLSQPATSLALQRLRELLGDPLLVRSGMGMVLTPRAEALKKPVAAILRDIADTFAPEFFDPATSNRVFRVTATDHAETILLPQIIDALSRSAPGIRLISQSVDALPLMDPEVQDGKIDATFAYIQSPPETFHRMTLMRERFVCVTRKGHPAFFEGMTLKAYAEARHILVSPQGGNLRGQVDVALDALSLSRFVAVSVPRFSVVLGMVTSTDLISTVPAGIVNRPEWHDLIDIHELPLPVPGFELMMLWHPRHHTASSHRWFRKLVAECISSEKDGTVDVSTV